MPISEMSDEDRAELFLVLGNVREEIRDLRDHSSNLRQVVVPREEHDIRRRFTAVTVLGGIFVAMNIHDQHIEQCMERPVEPGSLRAFVCDTTFPTHTHAQVGAMVPHEMHHHLEQYPTTGSVAGIMLYLMLASYMVKTALRVRRLDKRNVWR